MIVKIAFEKEIHLFRGERDLKNLKKHCQSVFKELPKAFEFYYVDLEGDKINMTSQQDLDVIFETQQKPAIKKFYIQEIDSQFEDLADKSNPQQSQQSEELNSEQFCYLPPQKRFTEIKTVNIVKQELSRRQEQNIKRQSFEFLLQLQRNIVDRIVSQQENIIKEQVAKYVQIDLSERIVQKVIRQQEKIINESVVKQVDTLISNFVNKFVSEEAAPCHRETKQIGVQNSSQLKQTSLKSVSRNQVLIDKIVEEKINKLMPSIIKKVVRAVQTKIMLNGCSQCERQKISDGEKHSSLAIKYCKRYREC